MRGECSNVIIWLTAVLNIHSDMIAWMVQASDIIKDQMGYTHCANKGVCMPIAVNHTRWETHETQASVLYRGLNNCLKMHLKLLKWDAPENNNLCKRAALIQT